jgi:hypothetical protein
MSGAARVVGVIASSGVHGRFAIDGPDQVAGRAGRGYELSGVSMT